MPTQRETILTALADLLRTVPHVPVLRGEVLPERISPAGLMILRDGNPGEPGVTLSPLTYHFQHRSELEVIVQSATDRDAVFDALLAQIGAVSRVDEVPRFINTGLDVLATSAMDLLGSLALKVALIDGTFDETERSAMVDYFVEEWGYDTDYVDHAVDVLEQNIGMSRLSDMAAELARFASDNPDCDYASIQKEILALLNEIAEADGNLDEREEMAIQKVEEAFRAGNSLLSSAGNVIGSTASGVVAGVCVVGKSAESTFSSAKSTIGTLSGKLWSKK